MERTAFIVFHGEMAGGPLCGLVNAARRANALDLMERAGAAGVFSEVVLYTDSPDLASSAAGLASGIVRTRPGPLHFGKAIAAAVSGLACARVCYFGSGAGPLLGPEEIAALSRPQTAREVLANNLYSMDFCAFTNDGSLQEMRLPSRDNAFARALVEKWGFKGREMDRGVGALFDIDAPLDLAALRLSGMARGRLASFVDGFAPRAPHLEKAVKKFTSRTAEVTIAGRISSDTHMLLDRKTACRVRLLTEERGMAAAGVEGSSLSIFGQWLDAPGPGRAFKRLSARSHAAFIDTRLLLACRKVETEAEERFASDVLDSGAVRNGYLRRLTEAAAKAPFPVVLANHSILNGGLRLLIEAAWRKYGRRPAPACGLRGDPVAFVSAARQ
jgi:hypothetical protein